MDPFVFIVGCPRSSTALLQRMVDAHPHVVITPEMPRTPRYFEKRTGLTPKGLVTSRLISRLLEHDRCAQLEVGREEFERLVPGTLERGP